MGICRLVLVGFEVTFNKHITGSFHIHHFDVASFPDYNSDFEVQDWFWVNFGHRLVSFRTVGIVDLDPEFDDTLGNGTGFFEQISILDRFVLDGLPTLTVEAIIQIYLRSTNYIISE